MHTLYNIVIVIYGFGIRLAAAFSLKAQHWVHGRKLLFENLEWVVTGWQEPSRRLIWFHCASLGEFEQGRPVMEAFRAASPGKRIVVSFFSPSGYLIRKNYEGADLVTYLPLDTPENARRWMEILRPSAAVFIKYEYWFNMILEMEKRKIPLLFISAVFRPGAIFFRSYGTWFRQRLHEASWIFVQRKEDELLLREKGFKKISIAGDTRFDRVTATARQASTVAEAEIFCGTARVIVAGSCWPEDERMLIPLVREMEKDPSVRFIFAPHDVSPARIRGLQQSLGVPSVRFAELTAGEAPAARVLVIDRIGLLSRLYRYAWVAFIGGAFGAGLHNILEAAAFGVPVLFGPRYHRFWEAGALIKAGGAWSVKEPESCATRLKELLDKDESHQMASSACFAFIRQNTGATNHIIKGMVNLNLL